MEIIATFTWNANGRATLRIDDGKIRFALSLEFQKKIEPGLRDYDPMRNMWSFWPAAAQLANQIVADMIPWPQVRHSFAPDSEIDATFIKNVTDPYREYYRRASQEKERRERAKAHAEDRTQGFRDRWKNLGGKDPGDAFWDAYYSRGRTYGEEPARRATMTESDTARGILYLRENAPIEVCEAAYRALAKLHHPDQGGNAEKMRQLNLAIETIRKER